MGEVGGTTPGRVHFGDEPFSGVDLELSRKSEGLSLTGLCKQVRSTFSPNSFVGREQEFALKHQQYAKQPVIDHVVDGRESVLKSTPKLPLREGFLGAFETRGMFFTRVAKMDFPDLSRAQNSFVTLCNMTLPVPLRTEPRVHFSETEFDGIDLHVDQQLDRLSKAKEDFSTMVRSTQHEEVVALHDDVEQFSKSTCLKMTSSTVTGMLIAQGLRQTGQFLVTAPPLPQVKVVGCAMVVASYLMALNLPFQVVDQLDRHNEDIVRVNQSMQLISEMTFPKVEPEPPNLD